MTLAILATYPLLAVSGTHVPQGSEPAATVPLLNYWTIWWNVDRINHGYQGYWDAPIYHPVPGIFAAVEPQTVVGWGAWPLYQCFPRGSAWVYNVLVLLFLTLNGWLGCRLLRSLRLVWFVSLLGGAMLSLLAAVHWQLGVFQLISIWGVLWTLLALIRFRRQPGGRAALHLAIAFAVTYSLCCYYGLFLSLLLVITAPILLGRRLRDARTWVWGAMAIAASLVLLSPILIGQLRFAARHNVEFPQQWVYELAASPTDYLRTAGPQLVPLPELGDAAAYPWPLSPGTLKSVAAISTLVLLLWTGRRRRRVVLFFSGLALAALLLSMGPRLACCGLSLHALLEWIYPGYGHARSLHRFAFFFQIAAVLLAAVGLHQLFVLLRRSLPHGWRRAAPLPVILLGIILACEAWPAQPRMYRLPTTGRCAHWIDWLSAERRSEACLALFPQPIGYEAGHAQQTAVWMYHQTLHARPMINGYTTFVPWQHQQLRDQLRRFPDATAVRALRSVGVTHVVFDREAGAVVRSREMEALSMTQVVDDEATAVEIWKLPDGPIEPPAAE